MGHGAQLKLDRAQAHIDEASEIVAAWLDGDAFTINPTTDLAIGRTEMRVSLREPTPDNLALVIGDAVHNLRVTLDHAVFDAAYRHAGRSLTEQEERALMFPVHETQEAYDAKAPARLKGVPERVRDVIKDVQPFRWAQPGHPSPHPLHPLWQLNELDVIDKHRRLTVTAASLSHHAVGIPEAIDPDTRFFHASGPVRDGQVLVSFLGKAAGVEYMFGRDVVVMEPTLGPQPPRAMDLLASLQREVTNTLWRMQLAE